VGRIFQLLKELNGAGGIDTVFVHVITDGGNRQAQGVWSADTFDGVSALFVASLKGGIRVVRPTLGRFTATGGADMTTIVPNPKMAGLACFANVALAVNGGNHEKMKADFASLVGNQGSFANLDDVIMFEFA
jgi:hypothetical protein